MTRLFGCVFVGGLCGCQLTAPTPPPDGGSSTRGVSGRASTFDHDGLLDLAIANFASGNVSLLYNSCGP